MSDEKETNEKKGFFSRFMKGEGNECGCGCCGGIKIVPKESISKMSDSDSVLQKETEEKILAFAERYAEKKGFVLNPNTKELADVISGLARNKINSGKQYCPCRLRTGDKEKDREIICPCIYHEDEIEKDGHCHCMLFFKS